MWKRVRFGWKLVVSVDHPDAPDPVVVWADDHLKVTLSIKKGIATYRVRIDQRRVYQLIQSPQWIALVFGRSREIRQSIKGHRLWRDKQIVLQKYGQKPCTYFLVAR